MDTYRMSKINAIKVLRAASFILAGTEGPTVLLSLGQAKNIVDSMEQRGDVFDPTPPDHACRQVESEINQQALSDYVDATIAHRKASAAVSRAERRENETFNKQHDARKHIIRK